MKRRWQEFMSEFDLTLEHIKAEENALPDLLSKACKPDPSPSAEASPPSPSPDSVLPPVITNHLHIRYPHIFNNLPPNYQTKMPAQRFSHITSRPQHPGRPQVRRLPPSN